METTVLRPNEIGSNFKRGFERLTHKKSILECALLLYYIKSTKEFLPWKLETAKLILELRVVYSLFIMSKEHHSNQSNLVQLKFEIIPLLRIDS